MLSVSQLELALRVAAQQVDKSGLEVFNNGKGKGMRLGQTYVQALLRQADSIRDIATRPQADRAITIALSNDYVEPGG